MDKGSTKDLMLKIEDLASRLAEAEQLIEAIKAGEVDAFALNRNNQSEIFTLQSGDYAYRVLVENFSEGAVNLTEEGLIVYTNGYFHNMLGLPYEKVIGNSVFQFVHPESKEIFNEIFKKSLTGQCKGEINLHFGQKTIPVYVSLTSLSPTLPTIGMIVTDLSEKKQNERDLEIANRQLEQKNLELAKKNTELTSFSYIASHDLQEPLRKIQTFASRLVEKEVSNLSEDGKMMFERMQIAAKRMQTLIDDLLVYSRTNNLRQKFERTALTKIVDEVKNDLKEELKEKNATIEVSEMCEAKILPFQFRQLLHNLIGNSLKFSIPQVPPHIKIKGKITAGVEEMDQRLSSSEKYCHISITDNGIGFDPQYSEKIFDLFQRLHNKEEYSGTGIGLSIVKRIVENHNGVIKARGELNKGATFDIFIPAVE